MVIAPPEGVAEAVVAFHAPVVSHPLKGFEPLTEPLEFAETPVVKSKIETTAAFAEPATAAAAATPTIEEMKV